MGFGFIRLWRWAFQASVARASGVGWRLKALDWLMNPNLISWELKFIMHVFKGAWVHGFSGSCAHGLSVSAPAQFATFALESA